MNKPLKILLAVTAFISTPSLASSYEDEAYARGVCASVRSIAKEVAHFKAQKVSDKGISLFVKDSLAPPRKFTEEEMALVKAGKGVPMDVEKRLDKETLQQVDKIVAYMGKPDVQKVTPRIAVEMAYGNCMDKGELFPKQNKWGFLSR